MGLPGHPHRRHRRRHELAALLARQLELDAELFRGAKIVNDSINLCCKSGETHNAVAAGIIKPEDVHAEIGEILLGQKKARENDEEITIFDTVGMAIQDNVMSAMLYHAAKEKGMGTYYAFFE